MAVKSLKEQLSQIALKKVKLSNGESLEETMAREARRLYDCIQYYIDDYYESYEPTIYERTYRYQGALYAEDIADIRVIGNTLRIGVGFHKDLAMHPNLSEVYRQDWDSYRNYKLPTWEYWIPIKDRHSSFVPLLMEFGWHAPRLANMIGRRVPRLTDFDGIHAVSRGIADFNKTNKLGIKIDAEDFYKGRVY